MRMRRTVFSKRGDRWQWRILSSWGDELLAQGFADRRSEAGRKATKKMKELHARNHSGS